MKKLIALILLLPSIALADTSAVRRLMGLGMSGELAYRVDQEYASSMAQNEVFQAGYGPVMVPFTATMAATPVVGTNEFKVGLNVIPTAAASTAALLGAATPTPGANFWIYNNSGAAVRAKAAGGATITGNGTVGAAGTYIGMAAGTSMHCFTLSSGAQACDSYSAGAVPTPAGP